MATRTWLGGAGSWFDATQWSSGLIPVLGDTVIINAGTVNVLGSDAIVAGRVDNVGVHLAHVTLQATDAWFGHTFSILDQAGTAELQVFGFTDYAGVLAANTSGATFVVDATRRSASQAPDFIVDSGQVVVSNGDNLLLLGTIDVIGRSTLNVTTGGTLSNDGIIRIFGDEVKIASDGVLAGSGSIEIALGGTLDLEQTATSQPPVVFGDAGTLIIANPNSVAPLISGARANDLIILPSEVVTGISYDAAGQQLTLHTAAGPDIVLPLSGTLANTQFALIPQNTGSAQTGTTIDIVSALANPADTSPDPRTAAADRALQADVVRQNTTLTGAGITVGIISDSFDAVDDGSGGLYQPGTAFVANATTAPSITGRFQNAAPGSAKNYLPNSVNVLIDSASGEDEGRAMAELVHQIAPGATLYFASGSGPGGIAAAVNALAAAHVDIIASDLNNFQSQSFYSTDDPTSHAVQAAIDSGVNYFTAAGNYQYAFYENNFAPADTVQRFTVTISPNTKGVLTMQWALPTGDTNPGLELEAASETVTQIFDSQPFPGSPNPLLPNGAVLTINNAQTSTDTFDITVDRAPGSTFSGTYKVVLSGFAAVTSSEAGGTIISPESGVGSGTLNGDKLVPGANVVGAAYWASSTSFGLPASVPEYFSSPGPGVVYFDAAGNPLTTPQTLNQPSFLSVDGVHTDVGPPFGDPFFGTSAATPDAAAVAALMLQADPRLTTAQVTQGLVQSAVNTSLGLPAFLQGAGLIQAPLAVQYAEEQAALCFAAGSQISTPSGSVAVEALTVGQLVCTTDAAQPVRWIGRRNIDLTRHPHASRLRPIRVLAHAFGRSRPSRDLLLSPNHAVFVDGVLIPIRCLVNGDTIRVAAECRAVQYFHIELAQHAVLLANNLLAESLLPGSDRTFFENNPVVSLRPGAEQAAAPLLWEACGYAPLHVCGGVVEAVRASLARKTGRCQSVSGADRRAR